MLQSSTYFSEIIKIKQALEKNGVEFVFLKGLPIHLYFEKSFPRRIYGDCDLLISPDHGNTVDLILIKLGYTSEINSQYSYLQ